jgi:shikimate kinase
MQPSDPVNNKPADSPLSAPAAKLRGLLGGRSFVMIGLMGAGKSAIGRRLAARLGLPFIDADAEIEAAAGETIESIFTEHGEEYFRDGERRVIARLLESGSCVLATGGGAFMNAVTRERIRDRGLSIWLNAGIDLLMHRVSRRDNRPLLKNGNPRETMERLIAERYPVYALADFTIESREVAHDIMVEHVINELISQWPRRFPGECSPEGETPQT